MNTGIYRFDIYPRSFNSASGLKKRINQYSSKKIVDICLGKTYWLEAPEDFSPEQLRIIGEEALSDSVIEDFSFSKEKSPTFDFDQAIQINFRPGVQDNRANSVKKALNLFFKQEIAVYSGDVYFLRSDLAKSECRELASDFLSNDLLNQVHVFSEDEFAKERFQHMTPPKVHAQPSEVEIIDFSQDLELLDKLNKERVWALSLDELSVIQKHFLSKESAQAREKLGLSANPTDVEIEVIAQTWSEHCKHKIFAALIEYSEEEHSFKKISPKTIKSLYKSYIQKSTKEIQAERGLDWLISVFSDNAGIVRFDPDIDLCIKVETHNSPSALDPYGGALTGILGVNRDILGTGMGAKPVANMDVFCFAHESALKRCELPKGLLHPKRILEGVHKGVEDGGNKSGIPTVNGSIFFDDHYIGKPLVYVGTVGVMPQSTKHYPKTSEKNYKAGDWIVMAGGRIGKDGIHGATFSSMELNEDAPATAVQIGDPFTQKKLTDFLLKARDLGLYSGITDNGAGGLSSSIGEMAEKTGGADIELSLAPVKYQGLSAYELMISESQERMTFAVPPENLDEFIKLAASMEVEASALGRFTDDGVLRVKHHGKLVAALDMEFLHEGLPAMELRAKFAPAKNPFALWHGNHEKAESEGEINSWLAKLLRRPNIASKEDLVRRYDHEVQASTVVKPFTGTTQSGPSDAGIISLKSHGGSSLVAIGNGNQPLYSRFDPYLMAIHCADEAVRNVVASGADPEKLVLLDNFCWPDPLPGKNNPDAEHKLAGLVRANEALYNICKLYGAPLVSGKDSMKNDFVGKSADGAHLKISVPPTLLVTSMAGLESGEWATTTDFKNEGDAIYLVGSPEEEKLLFSEYTRTFNTQFELENIDEERLKQSFENYKALHRSIRQGLVASCHDISEGGLIVSLCESSFGNRLGARLDLDADKVPFLVNEGVGLMLVSVKKGSEAGFEKLLNGEATRIGSVQKDFALSFRKETTVNLEEMFNSWRGLQ